MPASGPETQMRTLSPARTFLACWFRFQNSSFSTESDSKMSYLLGLAWNIQARVSCSSTSRSCAVAAAVICSLLSLRPLSLEAAIREDLAGVVGFHSPSVQAWYL